MSLCSRAVLAGSAVLSLLLAAPPRRTSVTSPSI
jgi:hypothetical protein